MLCTLRFSSGNIQPKTVYDCRLSQPFDVALCCLTWNMAETLQKEACYQKGRNVLLVTWHVTTHLNTAP